MGPGDFIPLAEYLGLITDIGDYILEEACRQCKKWNDAGYTNFHVNVNLSVVQLLQKNVAENINNIIRKSGVNPANIVLEITESFAINDMDRVLNIINGVKKLGPRIALDDFGTGYSSLAYLKDIPADTLKIDKTFVDSIGKEQKSDMIINSIVELMRNLGLEIIAEGVETKEQFEILKKLQCHDIQGFLLGKPMSSKDALDVIKTRK